jgi:hypothetical protein
MIQQFKKICGIWARMWHDSKQIILEECHFTLLKLLVLKPADTDHQRHSVRNNDHVYFFTQYIVTNNTVKVVYNIICIFFITRYIISML